MPDPPSILDDRGIARTLYPFPRTADGVPPDCPLSAREQAAVEAELGVPWRRRTPVPPSVGDRIPIVAVALPLFAISAACRPERLLVAERIAPARLAGNGGRLTYIGLGTLTLAVLLMPWAQGDRIAWPEMAVRYAAIGLPLYALLAAIDHFRDNMPDPRRVPRSVRRALLRRGRCPSCAEDIEAIQPDRDGRRTCTRCGAAWIIHAVTQREFRTRTCDGCGYSLEGLRTAADGAVRCPECGLRIQVAPRPARFAFVCWGCGRPLVGLELVNGDRVRCPDCGTWRSGLIPVDVQGAGDAS